MDVQIDIVQRLEPVIKEVQVNRLQLRNDRRRNCRRCTVRARSFQLGRIDGRSHWIHLGLWEKPLAIIVRAVMLTSSTRLSRTNPAAQAWRCQSGYGAMAYVNIITGSVATGWSQPGLQYWVFRAVNSSGTVSPAT